MKTKAQNFLVGMLLTTAIVLGCLVAFLYPENKADAMMISQGDGDLIMVTVGGANSSDEILYCLDRRSGKLIAYAFNQVNNRLQAIAGQNLKAAGATP